MSETLSEEELAQLIRHGRINSSKKRAIKRNQTRSDFSEKKGTPAQPRNQETRPPENVQSKQARIEPDPEWLKAQKEKAERNIATARRDKQNQDEMREASRF